MEEPKYPVNETDVIDEAEAKQIARCRSARTWESWHERDVIKWFVAPGTNKRLYSRAWLLDWIRAGAKGAAQ